MTHAVVPEVRRQQAPLCDRYALIEPIGSGGSGQVWLAHDELANRNVALKIVHGEGRAAERAEREATAVARLDDPRFAELYAIDRDDKNVYLVYEYIEGKTLRQALRDYDLSDADVVEVAAQILEALEHAHASGIVHRDIKPTNILLENSDNGSVSARVLDLGLALIDDVDALTAVGDVPGTLAYISPERLRGDQTSAAADVWSAGLILWEGLGGRHPFFTNSPVETAKLIADGAPSIANERPDVSPRLVALIEKALALDPADRPQPAELAQQLRGALTRTKRTRRTRARLSGVALAKRGIHAGLAAVFISATLVLFPFFPTSFTIPLAAGIGLLAFARPRLGLALALTVPVLPLGDISGGLAVAYAAVALAWFVIMRRTPTSALLPVGGPILASVGLLAAAPLLALRTSGIVRRALIGAAAVALAVAVHALRVGTLLPTGEAAPLGLGIEGSVNPGAVTSALAAFFSSRPTLLLMATLVAVASALAPLAVKHTMWSLATGGAAFLAALVLGPTLLLDTNVTVTPVIIATWVAVLALAAPIVLRMRGTVPAREPRARRNDDDPVIGDDASLADVWSHVVTARADGLRPTSV